MNKIKVGHFLGDGGIVYLPLGFVPDYFRMCDIDSTVTNAAVAIHEWFERMQDDEATGSQEGWALGFATLGYTTLHADDAGITAYNTGSQRPTVTDYATLISGSTTPTAKTATAPGTYAKPSTTSATDRSAIFECVGSTGACAAEPTWPDAVGEQVTDSGSNIWERVDVSLERGGYQGVCIQDDIQTNTHEYYYLALQADQSIDHGDVDGWTDGIDPNAN